MTTRSEAKNRLAAEKSPYLLQHAENPVDWYPWSEEAFEKARRDDKPVFLSIGYSTCHWCHVMAHESFEDEEVARLMNDTFVNIKLDREERPDLDHVYMTVCQMMTGSGGWPLTIVMTPDKEPFFAATYIPKTSRHGRLGMIEVVPALKDAWTNRKDEIAQTTKRIKGHMGRQMLTVPGPLIEPDVIDKARDTLATHFDADHGGFGAAPKFPSPHQLVFLLRHAHRSGDPSGTTMATKTLRAMARGGIQDQIGGGFHRYSVDAQWHVPHFEKMLYDQALHVLALTEAYEATRQTEFAATARKTIDYVLRDLRDPGGAFHSSEDADSEGEEGKFYVWTLNQMKDVLGDDARLAAQAYDIRPDGNYLDEATRQPARTNILRRIRSDEDLARELGHSPKDVHSRLDVIRRRLLHARDKRIRPHKDDKILTDWNGLMIAALARYAAATGDADALAAANEAGDWILRNLRRPDGRLFHRWRDGEAAIPGFLDDHVFTAWGLLELHQATLDDRWAQPGLDLLDHAIGHFWDNANGAFFMVDSDEQAPLGRQKDVQDAAIPSGNSVALDLLVRYARLTGRTDLDEKADHLIKTFSLPIGQVPHAFTHFLTGAMLANGPTHEVVIAGAPDDAPTRRLIETVRAIYMPHKVLLLRDPGRAPPDFAPFAAGMGPVDGRPAAYVCLDHACQRPTTDPKALQEQLEAARKATG